MRQTSLLIALAFTTTAYGCGSSSGGSTGAGGNGGGGSGNGGAGGLAACGNSTDPNSGDGCNTLEATGACVSLTTGTGTPPAATGGTLQAGTYDSVSRTLYAVSDGGNTSESRRETVQVTGSGSAFTVNTVEHSGTTFRRQTASVTTSNGQLTFTPTCPPPGDGGDSGGTTAYSATATSFTIYDSKNGNEAQLNVFMKR